MVIKLCNHFCQLWFPFLLELEAFAYQIIRKGEKRNFYQIKDSIHLVNGL